MAVSASVRAQHSVCSSISSSNDTVECDDVDILIIEELEKYGINASDINKLRNAGFYTVKGVHWSSGRTLEKVKGLSEAKIKKIKDATTKCLGNAFMTAEELKTKRELIHRITTGSNELDAILNGGIEIGSITEIHGASDLGKTQLCMTLCVTAQLAKEHGGGEGKVIYVDTEGEFVPKRLDPICDRYDLDAKDVRENILCARVYNHEDQMNIVSQIAAKIIEDDAPTSLVIIDSIMALFRAEFAGRGQLGERQNKLGFHLSQLNRLAMEFGVAILVTNQVMSNPDGFCGYALPKPIGGNILAHSVHTRLQIKKGNEGPTSRKIAVVKSSSCEHKEVCIHLTSGGFSDNE